MTQTMRTLAGIGLAAAVACVGVGGPARAAESGFLDRFKGTWSGSGTVIKGSMPWQVSCQAVGEPGENRIVVQGNCNAAIVTRPMIANLTFDPASGRYSGTYVGAKVGPAHLSGTRRGSVVEMTITWPKPVNGDTKAQLLIENAGLGSLRIIINDNPAPGAAVERTSDLVFSHL